MYIFFNYKHWKNQLSALLLIDLAIKAEATKSHSATLLLQEQSFLSFVLGGQRRIVKLDHRPVHKQSGASERVSGASERANGRASGQVLTSVFLAVFDHSALHLSMFTLPGFLILSYSSLF